MDEEPRIAQALQAVIDGRSLDPFAVLGPHSSAFGNILRLQLRCRQPCGCGIRLDDRATWDRAAWNRYTGTAMRLEPEFMPEMLRLIRDIERLERLAALLAPSQASAA